MRNVDVEIEEHTCATHGCGVTFWYTQAFGNRRRSDKESFYCPNGHSMSYQGETDEQKLRRITSEKNSEIFALKNELETTKRKCQKKLKAKK